jgi:hypothetical protein
MKLFRRVTGWAIALLMGCSLLAAQSAGQWDQPAASLAEQIAGIVGPGQATFTVRNLSSIPDAQVAAIRASIEKNLKSRGVVIASGESANAVRVTLSQNDRERLWVAEVVQGNETRVVMAEAGPGVAHTGGPTDYLTLRREHLPIMLNPLPGVHSDVPVLSALETNSTMVLLRPEGLELYSFSEGGWMHGIPHDLGPHGSVSRDARGMLVANAERNGFTAYSGGSECTGQYTAPANTSGTSPGSDWNIHCQKSDEPWPILQSGSAANRVTVKAFYNAARNYFTGVITPSLGVDLPPFYSAALLSRANGTALLVGGVDGKVQMVENGTMKPVSGARDWGSDFAVLNSGCGSGAQVIASGSGEAASDSLRAYELPAQEAVPASAPLSMNGTVMAIWPSPDGKSLLAAVRSASGDYEVDRVTALCN